ncbi:MAG: hypothetical protein JWN75_412 [Candidatus Saccharibacteria bacterium]|nr:hypothetical protein [Candidatus Saccharibacteria bacterium]
MPRTCSLHHLSRHPADPNALTIHDVDEQPWFSLFENGDGRSVRGRLLGFEQKNGESCVRFTIGGQLFTKSPEALGLKRDVDGWSLTYMTR